MASAFSLDEALAVLARTPRVLYALLRELPDRFQRGSEGPGTWNPLDVVAHLIDGECRTWMWRAQWIREHGESQAFRQFDRFTHQDTYAGWTMAQLLDEFARARAASLAELAAMNLAEADLDRRGLHPSLGPVTMRNLLATWVAHDLDHLMQISRVMARNYADDVGPWREYLRVISGQPG